MTPTFNFLFFFLFFSKGLGKIKVSIYVVKRAMMDIVALLKAPVTVEQTI